MTCGLVHASYSLPEWQAVKLTFFAPCHYNKVPASESWLFCHLVHTVLYLTIKIFQYKLEGGPFIFYLSNLQKTYICK